MNGKITAIHQFQGGAEVAVSVPDNPEWTDSERMAVRGWMQMVADKIAAATKGKIEEFVIFGNTTIP